MKLEGFWYKSVLDKKKHTNIISRRVDTVKSFWVLMVLKVECLYFYAIRRSDGKLLDIKSALINTVSLQQYHNDTVLKCHKDKNKSFWFSFKKTNTL